ncbi:hypothetical protein FE236_09655 [Mariprofundus erugo]|uniref:Cell division protein ZapD n=1 Tax=Mariprofundus erugo TaxID=2528639 RepID=A0A5R9GVF8_9PROT|nr:hypothetical protein [Mariprofundus erugo]TLS68935.1 hypothetical protein FEF65_00030 [Mariprofundus erugo]TLS75230.1 hypothetical protein FE236_09655 [Mariprofundus erugo]
MTEMVQFSFALSPRMRSFIELRDALRSLETARETAHGQSWLHAACDLRASLLGDQGRKNAVPEIVTLLIEMRAYLQQLAKDAPQYSEGIQRTCDKINGHIELLQPGLPEATHILAEDALINAYLNTQKKHDWLGHKLCMQQSIQTIWQDSSPRTTPLREALLPLYEAVDSLDSMFNNFVQWQSCVAKHGTGHITPEKGKSYGLLVVALPADAVALGTMPDISGNRLAIRIRFQIWSPASPPRDCEEDQPYKMMLVPVGYNAG